MAGEDIKQRSRRKHGDSTSGPHRPSRRKDDEGETTAESITHVATSVDNAAVRQARLERYSKLRIEEETSMETFGEAKTSEGKVHTESRRRRSERRGTGPLERRKTDEPRTKHRRKDERRDKDKVDSENEYVYGKPKERESDRRTSEIPAPTAKTSVVRKATSRRSSSNKANATRRSTTRRHTAPLETVESHDSANSSSSVESSPSAPRPAPPRSVITTSKSETSPLKRRESTTRPRTEVSIARSISSPKQERRPSGLFSNLLLPKPAVAEKQVSCLTCGSDDIPISKCPKLPCSHRMCHSCLKRIFKMSITDPAHMPPRCCTQDHIDLKHVDKLFDQNFKKTWNRKFYEYNTKNRLYCPSRNCGLWIKPNHITIEQGRKIGKCKKCGTRVCAICNNKAHTSRDCPKDPATKEFVEIAKKSGWQKCYSCSAMVELKEGCNHMTCRCTAEFCMICGLKWKSCDCPWFNYEQIDIHLGNPARYQEELDRRRDQVTRDEALARRMQQLGVDDSDPQAFLNFGNAAGHHMNPNFIQQARDALTANYQNAEQVARGLVYGWYTGRENPLPPPPPAVAVDTAVVSPAPPAHPNQRFGTMEAESAASPPPARRVTVRRRSGGLGELFGGRSQSTRERETERRIRDWADEISPR